MEWQRLYSSWYGHRKTLALSLAAKGLWLDVFAWVGAQETDGFVPVQLVNAICCGEADSSGGWLADTLPAGLVAAGLWAPCEGGWMMHNHDIRQPSAEQRQAEREQNRDRQKRWRERNATHNGVTPVTRNALSRRPEERREESPTDSVEPSGSTDAVETVFTAYKVATGRNGAYLLTPKRKALIRQRLRDGYEVADLVAAVQGWRHFPHNRGENDRGTPFNDLELLLRDAAHVERFRDAERGVSATPGWQQYDPAYQILQ